MLRLAYIFLRRAFSCLSCLSSRRASSSTSRPDVHGGAVIPSEGPTRVKLVWFVPLSHLETTRQAVFAAGAGWIGDYARCSFWTVGTGTPLFPRKE